jgi:radical SAM superfamily enzyme
MVLRRTRAGERLAEAKAEVEVLERGHVRGLAGRTSWSASHPRQVLHRLQADAEAPHLVAPAATPHPTVIRDRLEAELTRRGTRQGSRCASFQAPAT